MELIKGLVVICIGLYALGILYGLLEWSWIDSWEKKSKSLTFCRYLLCLVVWPYLIYAIKKKGGRNKSRR